MLMTYEKGKKNSALQDVINRIRQYNPEDSFVEFINYLKHNSILTYILNNDSSVKTKVIFALDEAAGKRISFLIGNDDKILELGKKYGELLNYPRTDKTNLTILQVHNLVCNAELLNDKQSSGVKKYCDKFAEDGFSIFASKNVLEYFEKPENRVAWIDANRTEYNRRKYIERLYALMMVEHITGNPDELRTIATDFPDSISIALRDKLRNVQETEEEFNSGTDR